MHTIKELNGPSPSGSCAYNPSLANIEDREVSAGRLYSVCGTFRNCLFSLLGPEDKKQYFTYLLNGVGIDIVDPRLMSIASQLLEVSTRFRTYQLPSLDNFIHLAEIENLYPLEVCRDRRLSFPQILPVYFPSTETEQASLVWVKGEFNPLLYNRDFIYNVINREWDRVDRLSSQNYDLRVNETKERQKQQFLSDSIMDQLQKETRISSEQEVYLDSLINIPEKLLVYGKSWAEIIKNRGQEDRKKRVEDRNTYSSHLSVKPTEIDYPIGQGVRDEELRFLFPTTIERLDKVVYPGWDSNRNITGKIRVMKLGSDVVDHPKNQGRPFMRLTQLFGENPNLDLHADGSFFYVHKNANCYHDRRDYCMYGVKIE